MSKEKELTSKEINERSLDLSRFKENILDPYVKGTLIKDIPADGLAARSLIPPLTATRRSFAYIGSEIPAFEAEKCVACMECVIQCPDAAIFSRANTADEVDEALKSVKDPNGRERFKKRFGKTTKLWDVNEKQGKTPAYFSIWIHPDRCKSCGECVAVCGDHKALSMVPRNETVVEDFRKDIDFISNFLPHSGQDYINDRLYIDLFMKEKDWIYHGGAGSCSGCGEITALKMAMTATSTKYGKNFVIVAATGCNSVYSSTYPYNIWGVPWTNSLFENAPAVALGVRMRLDQEGKKDTKIWVTGGDGAMLDIGFQSLSRAIATGRDINILVLDTQVYSNTGGQTSTSTYMGQISKMSTYGQSFHGKRERRKELGPIIMMHPNAFVAQVSPAYYNHFLKTVTEAIEYPGPSVIIAYSACQPEHGIADDASYERAKAAVVSRAFPLFVYDPRKGASLKERLDLKSNPSPKDDWHKDPKTGQLYDFTWFAQGEGRFSKQFTNKKPSEEIAKSQEDRLNNWHLLQEMAGLR
ncbi:MAG: hypothetical protein A3F16_03540 [Deltaproteobacteria bacterium RIFCSPHIGHO2_12_FULL_43_9]|nr:MAG: hypothetical protein A3F16_03540 [Deltaproteobacteria bacterium RIFCSPHIGHO2_12_FULL_43_9]